MAFGDSPCDVPLRDAWKAFCGQLEKAGDYVFKDYNPATPLHRVDGFRFLTQNLGQAFDLALEAKDTRYPVMHAFVTPYCKLGGDAADFTYQQVWIDGNSTYRISGNRGTARFFNVTVQGPRPDKMPGTDWPSLHEPFGDIPEANMFGHQLETAWDGGFELYIGGPQRGPNWLPTTPGSRKLFIRQGFDGWDELPGRIRIERVDMSEPQPLPTPERVVTAMEWAGNFMTTMMNDWPDQPYNYSAMTGSIDQLNSFAQDDPESDGGLDKKRGRAVSSMAWKLADDEAMVIEFDSPASFWMLANMGMFMTSMEYHYRPVSYTPARTKVDADGKVRIIMCHDDPGYHNWMDTQGFVAGNMIYRNLLSQAPTYITTRVVKRDELAGMLPAGTATVTPEERLHLMKVRFHSVMQRYSL